jgi:NADPH:quinone reductase-like Zn-dependent oxidoreductase
MGRPPAAAEVPSPRRRPGEALVQIGAAALNPVELHIWNGHFFDGPPPPYVIGLEGAGVVEEGELDTEELELEEIGDTWDRLARSAGRRLVVSP